MNGWHCPPDLGFEIRTLMVPSQARYLSVREALHNIEFNKKYLVSLTPGWQRENEMKWNESGFRPPLCTYRLNWARRTSWGWWDDWDDTVLQTQDSKFEPWRSEAGHATSRSRRLPTILTFTHGWGRNIFVSFKPPGLGTANHYPRAPARMAERAKEKPAIFDFLIKMEWIEL